MPQPRRATPRNEAAAGSPPASAANPLRKIGDSFDHHGRVWTLTAIRCGVREDGADEVEFRCPDYPTQIWTADPEVLRHWAGIHIRIPSKDERTPS
jgi:hypothetical protein